MTTSTHNEPDPKAIAFLAGKQAALDARFARSPETPVAALPDRPVNPYGDDTEMGSLWASGWDCHMTDGHSELVFDDGFWVLRCD